MQWPAKIRFFEPKSKNNESEPLVRTPDLELESPLTSPNWRTRILPLVMGQGASILFCLSGVSAVYSYQYGLGSASLQNLVTYFFIGAVFMTILIVRPADQNEGLKDIALSRGWKYFVISLFDVAGNYLVNVGYAYTSLTSVQLLVCTSVVAVLIYSYFFFKSRYTWLHLAGVVTCIVGVFTLVGADMAAGVDAAGPGVEPWLGDLLCVIGQLVYSFSNVSEEFFVKNFGAIEFLGFVGAFGAILSALLAVVVEDFPALVWTSESIGSLIGYGVSKFWYYVVIAVLLAESSAVAINLSVLSAGFYSVVIGLLAFGYSFSFFYILAFILLMGGVGLFSIRPITTAKQAPRLGPLREEFA